MEQLNKVRASTHIIDTRPVPKVESLPSGSLGNVVHFTVAGVFRRHDTQGIRLDINEVELSEKYYLKQRKSIPELSRNCLGGIPSRPRPSL